MRTLSTTFIICLLPLLFVGTVLAQWVQTNGPYGGFIYSIAVSPAPGGTNLFAGTAGGVYRSTNNGADWSVVNAGLTNTDIRALTMSPPDSSGSGHSFAGTSGGGVFLSTNDGTSWSAVNTGLTDNFVTAFAFHDRSIFAGTIYGGVFRSSNNGTSWTSANTGLAYPDIRALAVHSSTGGTNIFAGTQGGGVWRRSLPSTLEFSSDANTVALWHFNEGAGQVLHDSSGNGRDLTLGDDTTAELTDPTWASNGMMGPCLLFDSSKSQRAYASNPSTIFPQNELTIEFWYKTSTRWGYLFAWGNISFGVWWSGSSDFGFAVGDGNNWSTLYVPQSISSKIADGQWHYIACTFDAALLKIYLDGIEVANATSVGLALANPVQLWVGGRPSNTFINGSLDEMRISRRARTAVEIADYYGQSEMVTSVPFQARPIPSGFVLEQNYPNPFNPSTNFEFRISDRAFVSLKVFDLLGKEVATLVNEVKQPGEYTVRWDAANVPSGVYFCRLMTKAGLSGQAGGFVETRKLVLVR